MEIIKDLNEEGITVILITHFMEEAVQAGRIIILDCGEVMLDGTPTEIFSDVETLRGAGLDIPLAAELASYLRGRGIDVPQNIVTESALIDYVRERYNA